MKVYVTKYALTQGILELEGSVDEEHSTMFVVPGAFRRYYHKPFWHETREDAVKHADTLKASKIASIKKQIKKLEELKF